MESYYNCEVKNIDDLKITKFAFIAIIASRRGGKWVLCKHLIKVILEQHEIANILYFSDTDDIDNEYNFIDPKCKFPYTDNENIIKKFLNYQKKKKEKSNKTKGKELVPSLLVVFDDIEITNKNKIMIKLAANSRHYNIFVILISQHSTGLFSPAIRNNIDYCFFNSLNPTSLETILKSIHIPFNLKEFNKFFDLFDKDFNFILYDAVENDKHKRIGITHADILNLEMEK